MSVPTLVVNRCHTAPFPPIASGQGLAFRTCQAPPPFFLKFLPKEARFPIHLQFLGGKLVFGNAVINPRIVITNATWNVITRSSLPAKQAVFAIIVVITIAFKKEEMSVQLLGDYTGYDVLDPSL
jgi:hypothetical protein